MANGTATIEDERMAMLNQGRKAIAGSPMAKAGAVLSFGQKVSKYWLILAAAVLFDILGLIPILSIATNFIFGLILFLYFGNKGEVPFLKSGLLMGGGIIIDAFLSIFPVCIGTSLYRIAIAQS